MQQSKNLFISLNLWSSAASSWCEYIIDSPISGAGWADAVYYLGWLVCPVTIIVTFETGHHLASYNCYTVRWQILLQIPPVSAPVIQILSSYWYQSKSKHSVLVIHRQQWHLLTGSVKYHHKHVGPDAQFPCWGNVLISSRHGWVSHVSLWETVR